MRAVSTALDEGQDTLSLDCLQDHAPPTDICRQMALDAYEGEQKLKYTESNREHLWRLLQGGELIAPVPPLPPRGTPPTPSSSPVESATRHQDQLAQPLPSDTAEAGSPAPKSKKTRSRKKVEVPLKAQEQGSSIQAEGGEALARGSPTQRRKKTRDSVVEAAELGVQAPSSMKGEEASESSPAGDAVSPTKPKRTRRVGEPKPKRYAVGEKMAEPTGG